jgi:hypothetical protein
MTWSISTLGCSSVLAALCIAATGAAAQPGNAKPFKARLTLTETVQFTGRWPCFGHATLQAVGTASHLGRTTATSTDCVNPSGSYDPAGPNSFRFASMGSAANGLVFTAANGDRVYATYSGTVTAQPSGPHRVAGHFTITGGTGRFLGASGGGTLTGHEDLSQVVSATGRIDAEGTIVY